MKINWIFFLALALSIGPAEATASDTSPWWRGGTLHRATVEEWLRATEANKLATCADWLSAWERAGLTSKRYGEMDDMKPDALSLRACINESVQSLPHHEKISQYTSVCGIALGIIKRR